MAKLPPRDSKGRFTKRRPPKPPMSWKACLGWGIFWTIVFFPVGFCLLWLAYKRHPKKAPTPVRSAATIPSTPARSAAPTPSTGLSVEITDSISSARTDLPDGSVRYDYTAVEIIPSTNTFPAAGTILNVEPQDASSVHVGQIGILQGRLGEMAADFLRKGHTVTCTMGQSGTVDLVFVRPPRNV